MMYDGGRRGKQSAAIIACLYVTAYMCVCVWVCRSDCVSQPCWNDTLSKYSPLSVCCFKLGEMICCFLLDETGWRGILNSPTQIQGNKHRGVLVTTSDNHHDVDTTHHAQTTRRRLQICVLGAGGCGFQTDSRSPKASHIDRDRVQLIVESVSSRGLICLSIRSLLLYCFSPSWFVCQPRWLRCCPHYE